MKKALLLVASFGLLVSQGFGFNVVTTNISVADRTAVPILDNTGAPIAVGRGYVAVGTFSAAPNGTTAIGDIRSTFTAFGGGNTAFSNGVGAPGFFDNKFGASIPQGSAGAPVGEQAYVLIGDGATLAASLNFAILSAGGVFGTEDQFGNGELGQVFNAENIGSSLIYGTPVTNVDLGLGVIFYKGIKLGPTLIDTDGDGLADHWEELYGLSTSDDGSVDIKNGPEGDPDSDGLSNLEEQTLRTNPNSDDTDDDGLNDAVEDNGGEFISLTQTGTNPLVADTDQDGLSDGVEINQTQTDPTIADTDQDGIVDGLDDQDGDGLSNKDEIEIYGTSPLLADTDGDSIDDQTELEILSDPNTATTTEGLITIIRGMAKIQSTDSDGDGLTDVKEAELESDSGTATIFYLGDVYDDAVESALVRGRGEVTSTPQNFNLISTAAYAALQVECDSRFLDTDGDGLTDQKEKELESDSSIETTFYLTDAYDEAVNSALISGRSEVTSSPHNFDLISTVAYNALQLQRDADLAAYSETLAQKDGVIGTLNNSITAKDAAYVTVVAERDARPTLAAYETAVAESRTAGREDVTADPASYSLVTQGAYAAAVEFAANELAAYADELAAYATAELATAAAADTAAAAELAKLAAAAATATDTAAAAELNHVAAIAELAAARAKLATAGSKKKNAELDAAIAAAELAVAAAANASAAAELAANAADAAAELAAATAADASAAVERAELAAATATDTAATANLAHLAAITAAELAAAAAAELAADELASAVATARTAGQGDVTTAPASYSLVTQESYNTVIAERDARFTKDQINAMTVDPTVGRNAAGNMQVDISFIHSTDLENFTPFALSSDWVSVANGKITLEFPPNDEDTFFYRLGVQ